eukprot:5815526-Pyramimonas_sp.AAC.1
MEPIVQLIAVRVPVPSGNPVLVRGVELVEALRYGAKNANVLALRASVDDQVGRQHRDAAGPTPVHLCRCNTPRAHI